MMTYMARRNPKLIRNDLNLSMLNVVHGIYPERELSERALSRLVTYLNSNVSMSDGRIYCGGLTKFEPKIVAVPSFPDAGSACGMVRNLSEGVFRVLYHIFEVRNT